MIQPMIELLLALAVIPLTLPALSLLALTLAAMGRRASASAPLDSAGLPAVRVAVLVPAHNESANVIPTIDCLKRQLGPADRLLVIADNCSDDTAELARGAGAEVVERHDAVLRGKGYALAFGVDQLRADPPDVVLVVDADCVLSDAAVTHIAQRCHASGKPVQMLNLMSASAGASLRLRVLEFAMLMKNLVRPLGSFRLGGACHLMGTGMALPWALMASAKLATGHITEDMKLGVDLAVAGYAPQFLPQVRVSSAFPLDTGVAKVQKSRWEHGHLATLTQELPGLLGAALKSGKPALIVLAMDLLIPPVAFYFLLLTLAELLIVTAALLWPVWQLAAVLLSLSALGFCLAIALAWWGFGRHLLSARELMTTPLYALWKLPVYVAYFLKKRSGWVRTKRESE
jgi:cellulose synthase/poly-beta-1,6-N-acetylglucosamine synthase-like glycosyltransferase